MANPLRELQSLGQSVWLDQLDRDMILSGELSRLIEEDGLSGVTTNPKILHDAVFGSESYRNSIEGLKREGHPPKAIYESLAIEDVSQAADRFSQMYDRATSEPGFVSLEVDPRIAHDVDASIAEAKRLWHALDRSNVMIKVPGTKEGVRALTALTAEGVNVNVTLLFGVTRYREIADAYISGLEQRRQAGLAIDHVRSVASFFLSRIDTLVDELLEERAKQGDSEALALRGDAAIASAQAAYRVLEQVLNGSRFAQLARHGATPQRLLWASTGTKNPAYSELKYVEPLIGPNTVTTLPQKTLEAYRAHGKPELRLGKHDDWPNEVFANLKRHGVDIDEVSARLEREGISKFEEPLRELLEHLSGNS
jgi:transaldolase